MDFGLINLIKAKWGVGTGRQAILKDDFRDIEAAILQSFGLLAPPTIEWVDNTEIKVSATPDDIAPIMMTGFPSQLHRGMFVSGGLTDGRYRENTADVIMDFDLAASLWGTEKANQWYAIYALAGNTDANFTLKTMPYMRVKSQASQIISLGTLVTPATGIGYGFTTDELVGGAIYVFSGASKGLLRSITANNNDNSAGGTITYGGSSLSLAVGDWFIVLPPATNFRFIGDIFNDSGDNIRDFHDLGNVFQGYGSYGEQYPSGAGGVYENIKLVPPLATRMFVKTYVDAYPVNVYIGHPTTGVNSGATTVYDAGNGAGVLIDISLCKFFLAVDNPASYCSLKLISWGYPAMRR